MSGLAKYLSGKSDQVKPYKKGGEVKHDDEAMDKKLIKKVVKPSALKKCTGGMIKGKK